MKTSKRLLISVLALFGMVQGVMGDAPPYFIERSWDGTKVVSKRVDRASDGSWLFWPLNNSNEAETLVNTDLYLVENNCVIKQLIVEGDNVHLIICDGASLTANIKITKGSKLNIYGQEEGTGKLIAKSIDGDTPAIGIHKEGTLVIHGCDIYANSKDNRGSNYCAGIGGGEDSSNGTLIVYAGKVVAYGGKYGAGIGGGQDGSGGTITIYGGNVSAYGGTDAAGIGSGEETSGSLCDGGTLFVYGGEVFADGTGWGAGIGGGEDAKGAAVYIRGGTVSAWAGADAGSKNGCAIGCENGDGYRGSLSIDDKMMVIAGQNPTDAEKHLFSSDQRVPACFWRPYCKISPCTHKSSTYTVSGYTVSDTHTLVCKYCKSNTTEKHTFENNECTVCHVKASVSTVSIYLPEKVGESYTDGHYAASVIRMLVTGASFELPAPPTSHLPTGVTFAGWRVGTPTGLGISSYTIGDGEPGVLTAGTEYTVTADVSLTARYRTNDVIIANDADNYDILVENNGKGAKSVTLKGRTLYKDGSWNTICLPFDVTIAGSPFDGDDVDVRTLSSSSYADDVLTMTFTEKGEITEMTAGTPYLIKWDESGTDLTETDLVFGSKTIKSSLSPVVTDYVTFGGTFSPVTLTPSGDVNLHLYIGAENKIGYPKNAFILNSCRCYFTLLNGLHATAGGIQNSSAAEVRSFVLDFGDGDTTGVIELKNGKMEEWKSLDSWYTLSGQKLQGKPTAKGLYINNGRKIIFK